MAWKTVQMCEDVQNTIMAMACLPVLWGLHRTGFPRGSSSHTQTQSPRSPRSPECQSSPLSLVQTWWPHLGPQPWSPPPHWHRPAAEGSASSQCCHLETWENNEYQTWYKSVFLSNVCVLQHIFLIFDLFSPRSATLVLVSQTVLKIAQTLCCHIWSVINWEFPESVSQETASRYC